MKNASWFLALTAALALAVAGCSGSGKAVDSSELAAVPGGEFAQIGGSSPFTHTVSAFQIGKYEVTYDLWRSVYAWAASNGYIIANTGREGINGSVGMVTTTAKYQPVAGVLWRDIIVWCNAFSEMKQLKPVYYADAKFTKPLKDSRGGKYAGSVNPDAGGIDNPFVDWNAGGYRLPTEGEWQFAASYKDGKAWTEYNFPSGSDAVCPEFRATAKVAWHSGNSNSKTRNTGMLKPNALGLYDMSGNLWEWCFDWAADYPKTAVDYRGPGTGERRIVRGGCYGGDVNYLGVGFRGTCLPFDTSHPEIGFRLARTSK